MACHCTTAKLSSYSNPVGHGKMLHALLRKVSSSLAKLINLKCLSSLVTACAWHTCSFTVGMPVYPKCCWLSTSVLPQLKTLHHIHTCVYYHYYYYLCFVYLHQIWWNFISSRPLTCLSQITLHNWTSDFLSSRPSYYVVKWDQRLFHVKRAVTLLFTPPCILLTGTHWYTEHIHSIKYNRDV